MKRRRRKESKQQRMRREVREKMRKALDCFRDSCIPKGWLSQQALKPGEVFTVKGRYIVNPKV